MKKTALALFAFFVISTSVFAGTVEVTFDYQRQGGFASNQFAVWVEDAHGIVIKTLYVTDFTAGKGGWEYRQQSIPLWVRNANIAAMSREQIDAVSGATPGSGTIVQRWHCDDAGGNQVSPGEYVVFVEATLRGEKGVLYKGVVRVGGAADEFVLSPAYNGEDAPERGMIGNVKIRYTP